MLLSFVENKICVHMENKPFTFGVGARPLWCRKYVILLNLISLCIRFCNPQTNLNKIRGVGYWQADI